MVTFAQAQERAERWINGDGAGVPGYHKREVRVREFDLGFVAWAEARSESDGSGSAASGASGASGGASGHDEGRARLVIARDSGDTTLWPALPVDEVIRRYEEEYGNGGAPPASSEGAAPQRLDLEATSFLLTPPEWLQQAADQMGIPDRRGPGAAAPAGASAASGAASPWDAADTSDTGGGEAQLPPATVFAPPVAAPDDSLSEARTELMRESKAPLPPTSVSPAVAGPHGQGGQAGHAAQGQGPATPPPPQQPPNVPGPPAGSGGDVHHAATMLADSQGGPRGVGTPPPPPSAPPGAAGPGASDIADADTSRAPRGAAPSRGSGPSVPPPPGAPGTPGARPGAAGGPGAPGSPGAGPAGGYVPTQMVSSDELESQLRESGQYPGAGQGSGGGDVHHAATMLSDSQGGPGGVGGTPPPPPAAPGAPGGTGGGVGGDVHQAATMLAGPSPGGPATPAPPGPPPAAPAGPPPGAPGVPGAAPPAYGYPQQQQQPPAGQPTVGPGYMAVLSYRAPDGSEQQLIRRSAPGTPHPEWQILHELRNMNVPPQQVVELHTELESCELPGGYCARMVRENWPQVRVTHTAPYGRDHASRQQGMRRLIEHQGELHQVADGPARPAPCRVPLPPQHQIPPTPPIPPDAVGHELMQSFGPQGVFRFDQHAVSRQGVPDVVGQTLVWSGVPMDVSPFFWGQAQPGRPVPTLAELAQERGVQPGADAGSYLVMGNDFGRQLCVQYGTAHIVAVPLEGGAGGQPAQPQFVSNGLPEFVRCLAVLGRMWPLRYGLTQEQAGRWTVDFQSQIAALDPAALASPENWWAVLLEQMWDGLF
jgi:hypothetical protein